MSLALVPNATPVRVKAVRGHGPVSFRMMEMGLVDGAEVEIIGRAPMGGPLRVRVGDYSLSLRREHADLIDIVQPN